MLKCQKKDCTGCGVCAYSCSRKAITMEATSEGFLYPIVNHELCVDCNLCNQVCPAIVKQQTNKISKCYAVQLKDSESLQKCASGGAFYGIAKTILKRNGAVFGVKDLGRELCYTKAVSESQLCTLIGSKYYQCRMSEENYQEIINSTRETLTLVSGTPCMISAIKNLKGIEHDNLITFEILCQGVPDKSVIRKFYDEKEQKEGSAIVYHAFRSKDKYLGRNYLNCYKFENGRTEYLVGENDPLSLSFQRQIFLRESCYHCHYANSQRTADFTAGDLWGVNSEQLQFQKGCSVLLCNTDKANDFFSGSDLFVCVEVAPDIVLRDNIPFHHPVKRPRCRNWSYKLLNSRLSPTKVTWICCYRYYLKHLIMEKMK